MASEEELIGKKVHLVGKPEDYTPPTKNPEDCICGAKGDPTAGRILIANCPCCDGVQVLRFDVCNCPEGTHVFKTTLPPNTTTRLRYIDNSGGIA